MSTFFRVAAFMTVLPAVACSTVDKDKTVPAFKDAISSGVSAFSAERDAESQAYHMRALDAALASGTIQSSNCWTAHYDPKQCSLKLTVDNKGVSQRDVATQAVKLASAMSVYAQAMVDLAAAKDITDRDAAIEKAAKGIGDLSSLAGVPGVEPVLDLVSKLAKDIALQTRRKALLRVANAASASINAAAKLLQNDAILMQNNIIANSSQVVADKETALAIAPAPKPYQLAQDLYDAVNAESAAANVNINIDQPIEEAHRKMVASLSNPKASLSEIESSLKEISDQYGSIETAFNTKK